MLNEDYAEMLRLLLKDRVKFLIVGAYAMGAQGYPRATGDIDIWVKPTLENSKKIYKTLTAFGAPLSKVQTDTFAEKGIVFQIGVAPRRIDILTHIDGVDFDQAYQDREKIRIDGLSVPFLSKANLIKNKEATGRDKDKLDAKYLKAH
ncbi:MAG: hypothetical protein WC838_03240 [Candidatus Margulisiibacteriota bacterium]|jgi:hypothetical protein